MKDKLPLMMGFTFVLYITSFFCLQLFSKESTFSELENRNLATKPTFTMDTLLDGSFGRDFETYIADQFPFRNSFISTKSYSELALQKKDNNGVYIGKDHYFLQNFKAPDLKLADRNAGYINELAKKFNVYVALSPTATKVLEDKLPNFATPYDEGSYIDYFYGQLSEEVHKVPLLETLIDHRSEEIYYKTDHHWTTLGAYYGYTAFCETAGLSPLPLDAFKREIVSTSFFGTLFSKGNFTFAKPDHVELFYPLVEQNVSVTYEATGETTNSFYDYSYLEKKDKYSIFFNGNHPIIHIKTGVNNGKKLLVIKDSYANAFIPFLAADYEEIQVVDLRLVNLPLATYANEAGIEDVLFLYNVQNFSVEGKLSLILK